MKTVNYEKTTKKILGWYDNKIHKTIPTPNMEVEDEVWRKAIAENANYVDLKTKTIFVKDFRTVQEIILSNIDIIKTSLMTLCDKKQDDIQNLILGYKNTPKQIERYKDKYERAKVGEWDETTNALIIQNHEQYLTAMRNLVDLIEYFRSTVDDLIIAEQLDKAKEVIKAAESFDENTTLVDIQGLFA